MSTNEKEVCPWEVADPSTARAGVVQKTVVILGKNTKGTEEDVCPWEEDAIAPLPTTSTANNHKGSIPTGKRVSGVSQTMSVKELENVCPWELPETNPKKSLVTVEHAIIGAGAGSNDDVCPWDASGKALPQSMGKRPSNTTAPTTRKSIEPRTSVPKVVEEVTPWELEVTPKKSLVTVEIVTLGKPLNKSGDQICPWDDGSAHEQRPSSATVSRKSIEPRTSVPKEAEEVTPWEVEIMPKRSVVTVEHVTLIRDKETRNSGDNICPWEAPGTTTEDSFPPAKKTSTVSGGKKASLKETEEVTPWELPNAVSKKSVVTVEIVTLDRHSSTPAGPTDAQCPWEAVEPQPLRGAMGNSSAQSVPSSPAPQTRKQSVPQTAHAKVAAAAAAAAVKRGSVTSNGGNTHAPTTGKMEEVTPWEMESAVPKKSLVTVEIQALGSPQCGSSDNIQCPWEGVEGGQRGSVSSQGGPLTPTTPGSPSLPPRTHRAGPVTEEELQEKIRSKSIFGIKPKNSFRTTRPPKRDSRPEIKGLPAAN